MKRIYSIIFATSIILMSSFSIVSGQDNKSEQKIKIIVDDGSGTKVVIDTIIKDIPKSDSIMLKDGSTIFLKRSGNDRNFIYYSRSESHERRGGEKYRIITRTSKDHGDKGEDIYINRENLPDKEIDNSINVSVSDSDNDSTIEKTKYIIAKDGMVVTVEGNDEARTMELVKEIESKLGVKSEGTENKETVKVESKKIIKK